MQPYTFIWAYTVIRAHKVRSQGDMAPIALFWRHCVPKNHAWWWTLSCSVGAKNLQDLHDDGPMLKGFVGSLLGHSLSRAVLVSVADTRRLNFRNNHERFYKSKILYILNCKQN